MNKRLFTSESVTEGHPDKVCDQIADAVLDAVMAQDPTGRVACEVCANGNSLLIMGEMTARASVDMEALARQVILDIGYDRPELGFDGRTCAIRVDMKAQSPDIAQGVDYALEVRQGEEFAQLGAGDQGMMFGYACDETPEKMPYSLMAAHTLAYRLAQVRKKGFLPCLRPDGKTQVTVEYGSDGTPHRVDSIVISTQHDPELSLAQLESDLRGRVIEPVIPACMMDRDTRILINPTGRFVVGGPAGDSGLTGGRSLWIPTADTPTTEAVLFPGKTAQKWTALPPTTLAMPPKMWWPQVLQGGVRSNSPTPSGWPSPPPSGWKPLEQEKCQIPICNVRWRRSLTSGPPP